MRPSLELADLHLRTLYVHDAAGRIVKETVDEGRAAPRLVVVRTDDGTIHRVRDDVSDDVAQTLMSALDTSTLAEEPGGGPMYVFPDDIAPDPHAVEISPGMFAWKVDGRAVAWCFSSRDIGEAVQAGVETKEEFRGRGFAPRVVSTWGAAMKDRGVEPIYSTSRANLASQSVARKLGLICIGSDFNVH